jgi:hypothetical protein
VDGERSVLYGLFMIGGWKVHLLKHWRMDLQHGFQSNALVLALHWGPGL